MTDLVSVRAEQAILHIRLDRPEKKNALTVAMYSAVADALARAEAEEAIRVVTITGSGDSFTAGNDILDFLENPPSSDDSPVWRFLIGIATAKKPIIAAVNGLAVGVGVTLLLHCDLVYASRAATFQMPFVNLGILPEAASTLLLPRSIGHQRAAELLMLGERFDAESAYRFGLVNALLPPEGLAAAVAERAATLAAKPPSAIRTVKSLLREGTDEVLARMRQEADLVIRQLATPEAQAAMQAFMQRKPK
jgi:enoyl-CoA hydratase/carnithine racemase